MKNLRDALLKAGVVSEKQKRRVEHEKRQQAKAERKRDKEQRAKGPPDIPAAPTEEHTDGTARSGEALPGGVTGSGQTPPVGETQQAREVRRKKARELILAGQHDFDIGGRRRFYFVTRDGSISFLPLSDRLGMKLERGLVAIVEDVGHAGDHTVVDRETAMRLEAIEAEMVRFFIR